MLREHHAQNVVARTAFRADAAALEVGDASRSVFDRREDVAIGFCAAEANDHVLRLSLNRARAACRLSHLDVIPAEPGTRAGP